MLGNLGFIGFYPIVDLAVGAKTPSQHASVQQPSAGIEEADVFVEPRAIQK